MMPKRQTTRTTLCLETLEDRCCPSITLVTSRAVLAGTDFIHWQNVGPPNSSVTNPFTAPSDAGTPVGVSAKLDVSRMEIWEEYPPNSAATWRGNFGAGDYLLKIGTYHQQKPQKNNPLTFDFGATAVFGGGAQISSYTYGPFVAKIEAFNASGVRLASFTEGGNNQNTGGDNSAIFIGIRSDTANISKIAVNIISADQNIISSFVINQFDFKTAPSPLTAAAVGNRGAGGALALTQVEPLLAEAVARWQSGGIDVSALYGIDIRIADLGGTTLGLASGNTIYLDDNAAGWGWFVDRTPGDDSEFTTPGDQGEQNRMDLLTVLAHEIGHLLGHDHEESGVMADALEPGIRRTPGSGAVGDLSAVLDLVFSEAGLTKRRRYGNA